MPILVPLILFSVAFTQNAAAQTLVETLSNAYQNSPDLKAARAALNAQNELRPQALGNWLPTVTINGQANRTLQAIPGPTENSDTEDGIVQLNIGQPITSGGGEFARLSQAEHLIRQQRALLLQSEEAVLFNAASAHIAVFADEEQLQYQIAYRDRLRQAAAIVERLVKLHDRPISDLALTQARLNQAEASVATAQGQLERDRAAYEQIVGAPPLKLSQPPSLTVLPEQLEDAVSIAQNSNADVVAADYAEEAAKDGVDIATSALLPRLSFNAFWQRDFRNIDPTIPGLNGNYDQSFIGLQLTVPLYQAGVAESQVRQAKKTSSQFRFQLDSARLAAISTARQAWAQRDAAASAVQSNQSQITAAQAAVAGYNRQLAAGLVTIIELLDAYQQLVGAQVALSQSYQTLIVSQYDILASVGGLTARSLQLPVTYYDSEGDYNEVKWKIYGLSISPIN